MSLFDRVMESYASAWASGGLQIVEGARRPLATIAERIDVAGVYVTNTKTGKKLLLKRRDGRWDITKGGVDKGEKPKQAAKREAGEESGIIPKVSAVYVDVTNPKNKKKLRIYKGSTKKTKIKLMPSEHTKAKWVDDDEAIEKLQQTPHLAKAVAKLRKLGEAGSLFARVVESYPNRVRGQARDLAVPGGGDKQPPEAPSDEPEQPLDSPGPGNVNVRTTQRAAGSKMHKQREPNVPPVALRQLRPLPALP